MTTLTNGQPVACTSSVTEADTATATATSAAAAEATMANQAKEVARAKESNGDDNSVKSAAAKIGIGLPAAADQATETLDRCSPTRLEEAKIGAGLLSPAEDGPYDGPPPMKMEQASKEHVAATTTTRSVESQTTTTAAVSSRDSDSNPLGVPHTKPASSDKWLETKKKKRTSESQQQQQPRLHLPLDWTRVKRRRTGANSKDDDDCLCPAPGTSMLLDESSLDDDQELIQGLAVFCLHDTDPKWFQGYFFPSPSSSNEDNNNSGDETILKQQGQQKPWGLLCQQEELDDCMQCADGGYRKVTMTIFPFSTRHQIIKKQSIANIEWTGGDMMRLSSPQISLEPNTLLTDAKAVPVMEKCFSALIEKCRNTLLEDDDEPCEILDVFPNLAILSGPMKLVLSKAEQE